MHARKLLAGAGHLRGRRVGPGPDGRPGVRRHAADPDDTDVHARRDADLIGVGSDTSQHARQGRRRRLQRRPRPPPRSCTLRRHRRRHHRPAGRGAITRPNGSGAGKALLYGGSQQHRHRLRPLVVGAERRRDRRRVCSRSRSRWTRWSMAVSGNVASHAPARSPPPRSSASTRATSPTGARSAAPPAPSSRRSRRPAPAPAASSPPSCSGHERRRRRDPRRHRRGGAGARRHPIKNDPDAIAPFSMGRADAARHHAAASRPASRPTGRSTTWSAAPTSANADVLAAFGANGYFCSAAAKPLIEAAGFQQLFTPSKGGVCGQPTQSRDHQLHHRDVTTTTTVTVTSASASSARIVAAVTGSTAAQRHGRASSRAPPCSQSGVPLVSGQARPRPDGGPGRAHLPGRLHPGRELAVRPPPRAPAPARS